MHGTCVVQRVMVALGDCSTLDHVGVHLLGELADRIGLISGLSAAVVAAGERAPTHDWGWLLVQAAITLAENATRSSTGTNPSIASINADLPAAEVECTSTANGRSSLRDTAAK
jgi:hypothetical protein